MPEDKVFLDTNIIVYAYDISAGEKHETARKIIIDLWDSGLGLVSTQVLQELFVTVTQKIPGPLDIKLAKEIVNDLLKWEVVVNDGDDILEAIEIQSEHNYSFWDSMIIQAAVRGGANILLTEDLDHGLTIEGITIQNPFLK
ncbi:PIN domain-containing protein [bacterium]|nr:PIN domain-containing protein [bacterium]